MMKKTLKIVVLAKQVPDTRNVGKDAMKADGTVNRAALAAIFNPEDLNALEQALVLKDMFPGSRVEILTMGPGRAAEIIREGMFRGADGGVLLTDRKFAGSDTLATSYALSRAALKMNPHIIVAGRQAIDGDTAQVGPQVAEKLNWPQVTYAEEIVGIDIRHAPFGNVQIRARLAQLCVAADLVELALARRDRMLVLHHELRMARTALGSRSVDGHHQRQAASDRLDAMLQPAADQPPISPAAW